MLLFLLLIVALILVTVSIASANEIFVFGVSLDLNNLDPGEAVVTHVADNIFECLLKFRAGTTSIEPCLATTWKISTDGKEITFHLRKGVKFHDGTEFNADAVVFFWLGNMIPIILTMDMVNGIIGIIYSVI